MIFLSALVGGTPGDPCCDLLCDHTECDWPDEHCDFDSGLCECSGFDCNDNGGGGGGGGGGAPPPESSSGGSWFSRK